MQPFVRYFIAERQSTRKYAVNKRKTEKFSITVFPSTAPEIYIIIHVYRRFIFYLERWKAPTDGEKFNRFPSGWLFFLSICSRTLKNTCRDGHFETQIEETGKSAAEYRKIFVKSPVKSFLWNSRVPRASIFRNRIHRTPAFFAEFHFRLSFLSKTFVIVCEDSYPKLKKDRSDDDYPSNKSPQILTIHCSRYKDHEASNINAFVFPSFRFTNRRQLRATPNPGAVSSFSSLSRAARFEDARPRRIAGRYLARGVARCCRWTCIISMKSI